MSGVSDEENPRNTDPTIAVNNSPSFKREQNRVKCAFCSSVASALTAALAEGPPVRTVSSNFSAFVFLKNFPGGLEFSLMLMIVSRD